MIKIFWTPSIPRHWILEDAAGRLHLVPAVPDGWARRTPYHGPRETLKPMRPAALTPGMMRALGIPEATLCPA